MPAVLRHGSRRRKNEITMLIVPRDAKTIQLAKDIADAYPVLLVVYRQTGGVLDLHAWNGESWVAVSVEDYTNGTFFANAPKHAILIQPGRVSVPDMLTPSGVWCQSGNRLLSTDPRVLIHLLGRHFDFPYRHWKELADRYGYTLEQVNPALINVYWWHYRGDVVRNKLAQRDPEADLDQWYALEIIPPPAPPVEEPAEEEAETEPEPVIAEPAEEAPVEAEETEVEEPATEKPLPVEEVPAAPAEEPPTVEKVEAEPVVTEPAVEAKTDVVVEEIPAPAKEPVKTPPPPPEIAVEEIPQPSAEPVAIPEAKEKPVAEADPFSDKEIPEAEVVLPKKSN